MENKRICQNNFNKFFLDDYNLNYDLKFKIILSIIEGTNDIKWAIEKNGLYSDICF